MTIPEKVKAKVEIFKEKARSIKEAALVWGKEHPEEAAGLVCSVIFVGGGSLIKAAGEAKRKRDDYVDRECRQWDPQTGQYYYTRRPLKNREKLELESRMAQGERKGEILKDMRVL